MSDYLKNSNRVVSGTIPSILSFLHYPAISSSKTHRIYSQFNATSGHAL